VLKVARGIRMSALSQGKAKREGTFRADSLLTPRLEARKYAWHAGKDPLMARINTLKELQRNIYYYLEPLSV
jgi:hypothetical protein